jgi:plastocyanin
MKRLGLLTRGGALCAAVALVGLAGCGKSSSTKTSSGTTTQSGQSGQSGEIDMRAGLNDPNDVTIAVLQYLPQSITVEAGTTVAWAIAGPEPHSVTFFPPGQSAPPPGSDTKLFAPTPAANGVYDGKSLVNSGLVPQGPQAVPPFKLRFDTPGKYTYQCVIHAQMTGTVTVVAKGQKADTQADVQSRGDSEMKQWIAEGEAAKKDFISKPVDKTTNADGTTTWTIHMGTSTAHTDILAFTPVPANIKAKDKITFVNDSGAPHTATFAGKQTVPQDPESPQAQNPTPGPSPQTLNATDLFNTGTLPPNAPPGAGPPLAARSYTYTVPTAGTYNYVCIYHVPSGMAGTISVS